MKIISSGHIKAADEIRLHDRTDLATTVIETGPQYEGDSIHLTGTPAHRADFLRRLAVAATQAADELDAGEQVA